MADFEETLNQILSSPQAMEQIMSLAGSISGSLDQQEQSPPASGQEQPQALTPSPLSGADPALLGRFLPLLKAYQQGNDDDKTRLLEAMRPFLKPERAGKLDQAIRITRLSRVIRSAMELLRGEGDV